MRCCNIPLATQFGLSITVAISGARHVAVAQVSILKLGILTTWHSARAGLLLKSVHAFVRACVEEGWSEAGRGVGEGEARTLVLHFQTEQPSSHATFSTYLDIFEDMCMPYQDVMIVHV